MHGQEIVFRKMTQHLSYVKSSKQAPRLMCRKQNSYMEMRRITQLEHGMARNLSIRIMNSNS